MSNRAVNVDNLLEFYETPIDVTIDLLELGVLKSTMSILEPTAGRGKIVKALRSVGYDWHITAVEINDEYESDLYQNGSDTVIIDDFLTTQQLTTNFDLVIINPPYSNVEGFIEKGLNCLNKGGKLCALLRMGHLVGVKRGQFLTKHKPLSVNVLCHRPQFCKNASDIGGYAWVIWQENSLNDTIMTWIRPENYGRKLNGKR